MTKMVYQVSMLPHLLEDVSSTGSLKMKVNRKNGMKAVFYLTLVLLT